MKKQNNRIRSYAPIIVVLVIVGGLLGWYLISRVFGPPDNLQNACVDALPQNMKASIKIEIKKDGGAVMDVGGQRGVQSGATPQQIEQFTKCLELTKVTIENGVLLRLEPVGQVANRWNREPGLTLTLMPGSNDKVLNNLRFGPAVGPKEEVVRAWCTGQAVACVTCEPDHPAANDQVLVRLRDHAPVEERRLPGTWQIPQPSAPSQPWQLVNNKGERSYYECKQSSQ